MQNWNCRIDGVTPYMQHRMDDIPLEDWEMGKRGNIIERIDATWPTIKSAEYHSYFDESTMQYFIPSEHIRGSLINGGGYVKAKVGNARKSMANIVAGMFDVIPEMIYCPKYDEMDKRSAVNRNTKGRVMVVRPRWNVWFAEFLLQIGENTVTEPMIREIFRNAGDYCGMGSYRPTAKGKFGRYKLTSLDKLANT